MAVSAKDIINTPKETTKEISEETTNNQAQDFIKE